MSLWQAMSDVTITISTATFWKIAGFLILGVLVYLVRDILLLMFVSLIFASLIDPFAASLKRRGMPRALSVLFIYIILFGVVGTTLSILYPILKHDVPQFVSNLTHVVESIDQSTLLKYGVGSIDVGSVSNQKLLLTEVSEQGMLTGLFSTVSGLFTGIFSLVLILVLTFYMVVQDDPLKKIFRSVFPEEQLPRIIETIRKIQEKLGSWMRGQLLLSLVIGIMVTAGLSLLQVKYAAVLGLLAAILEFVPYIGPFFAAVPALLLAFSQHGTVWLILVLLMYIVIQQLENHILVPKIMQRAVGLNPIISIVAILVGAKIAGVIGALVAIPVATASMVIVQDVFLNKKTEQHD